MRKYEDKNSTENSKNVSPVDNQNISHSVKPFIHRLVDFFINNKISDFLPNLTILLKIYLTILVSSSTPERSFSCLKCLKTYLIKSPKKDFLIW